MFLFVAGVYCFIIAAASAKSRTLVRVSISQQTKVFSVPSNKQVGIDVHFVIFKYVFRHFNVGDIQNIVRFPYLSLGFIGIFDAAFIYLNTFSMRFEHRAASCNYQQQVLTNACIIIQCRYLQLILTTRLNPIMCSTFRIKQALLIALH